jgi:hypothetical protein
MEAIRRRLIPKDLFKGFGFFPPARPQFAFAGGGQVAGGDTFDNRNINIPVTVNAPISDRTVAKMESGIRRVIVQVMKEESRD